MIALPREGDAIRVSTEELTAVAAMAPLEPVSCTSAVVKVAGLMGVLKVTSA
ncbi:MAG: hypothetical protein H7A46_08630 [Verrucomicrobiales bacterium]|nr:hypothetical protein [Verrucomicrobiales bacterium]